jgi:hypothetical protein
MTTSRLLQLWGVSGLRHWVRSASPNVRLPRVRSGPVQPGRRGALTVRAEVGLVRPRLLRRWSRPRCGRRVSEGRDGALACTDEIVDAPPAGFRG